MLRPFISCLFEFWHHQWGGGGFWNNEIRPLVCPLCGIMFDIRNKISCFVIFHYINYGMNQFRVRWPFQALGFQVDSRMYYKMLLKLIHSSLIHFRAKKIKFCFEVKFELHSYCYNWQHHCCCLLSSLRNNYMWIKYINCYGPSSRIWRWVIFITLQTLGIF